MIAVAPIFLLTCKIRDVSSFATQNKRTLGLHLLIRYFEDAGNLGVLHDKEKVEVLLFLCVCWVGRSKIINQSKLQ